MPFGMHGEEPDINMWKLQYVGQPYFCMTTYPCVCLMDVDEKMQSGRSTCDPQLQYTRKVYCCILAPFVVSQEVLTQQWLSR